MGQSKSALEKPDVIGSLNTWRSDPEDYFRNVLGIEKMWDGQMAILDAVPEAIREKKNIVVPSGHSLGKDFICGGLVPYFLQVWGPCIVITTAPTGRQVESVMWGEIKTRYDNAKVKLPGRLLTNKIDIDPNWYALGFTTKETGSMVGKFQGFHSPRVFVIASEAQAIPDLVYEQIEAILTGEIGLLIQIGNPLRASGRFARDIKDKKNNFVIRLSCLDTPNYKQKESIIPGVCSYEWVEKKRESWGENDPRWYGRVLGKVPMTSIDSVFSQELIDKMVNRDTIQTKVRKGQAIDVARFGDDETVHYGGTNGKVEEEDIYAGLSITTTAARAIALRAKLGGRGNFIMVDADGLGAGCVDVLQDMNIEGLDVVEIHSAGKPSDDQYQNLKAEMWFIAKKRAEEGQCSIPDDEVLKEELLEIKFFVNKRGKIQIEDKDDVKERLGRSPNRADAWVYLQYGFEQADPITKKDAYSDRYDDMTHGVLIAGADRGAMAA